MKEKISKRVEILHKGAELTSGDRDKTYGDPNVNLECYGNLVNIMLDYGGRNHRWNPTVGAHGGALLNVLSKISRVICGAPHEDNYVDGCTYFAIAGEAAAPYYQQFGAVETGLGAAPVSVLGLSADDHAKMRMDAEGGCAVCGQKKAKARAPKRRPARKR